MTDTIKHTLKAPITDAEGKEIKELTLREATVGDMIDVEESGGTELAQTMRLHRRMAGLDEATFRKLSSTDIKAIVEKTSKAWGEDLGNGGKDGAASPS